MYIIDQTFQMKTMACRDESYSTWMIFNGSQLAKMKKSIPDISLP